MIELMDGRKILCMDILIELFQYFYVDELFKTFNYTLNSLPLLLKKGNVRLYVRYVDAYFRKHILPYIEINNVISIQIPNMYQMAPVDISQFNQVRLLILHNVTDLNWPQHFPMNVKHLIIHVRSKHRREIFRKALSLKHVRILEFHSTFLHFDDCNEELVEPSSITHLKFNSKCCVINYQFLLNNMPNLLSLQSTNTYYPHRVIWSREVFRNLHTIDLTCKHMDMNQMIFFLRHVAIHSLRRCRLINIKSSLSPHIVFLLNS